MGEVGSPSLPSSPQLAGGPQQRGRGAGAQHRRRTQLFMKDLHLMLSEGRRLNIPLPLTNVAERL